MSTFLASTPRVRKDGSAVWIQGAYNPILDDQGRPIKVVKFATDITLQKLIALENTAKMDAIGRAQAVIEFEMDGTIISANDNFLNAMGYTIEEIRGRHHSIFVDDETRQSAEYKEFWATLNRGEHLMGEYRRVDKSGNDVWIDGSYSPILDLSGKPFKVVKYASDVTERVTLRQKTQELIDQVVQSASQFTEGSQVIAASSISVSDGAQSQAASIEQITASIDGMLESIRVISESATGARGQANETAQMAQTGGSTVGEAVAAMRLIQKSSEQINEIIAVISEIASQTNLLALNAAIEAARAGRAWSWIRRGRRRSSQTGRTLQPGRERDYATHQRVESSRRRRCGSLGEGPRVAAFDRHRR